MFNEEAQRFAVVNASDGGSAGSEIILCSTLGLFPAPPLNAIGNSDWNFLRGWEGTMYAFLYLFPLLEPRPIFNPASITLSGGRNLAWNLQTAGFGTQARFK